MSQLVLTAETLAGTPAAGTTEYNGTIETFTPLGNQRGIVPSEQFFSLNSGLVGANATGAQSIFGVGVTLSASTVYEFEAVIALSKTVGATSRNVSLGFGGTATLNNIGYESYVFYSNTGFTATSAGSGSTNGFVQTASASAILTGSNSATDYLTVIIKGIVSINAGGTFTPQYTLSAAPGGAYTTAAGSYMKIKPIGVAGANVSVGTWA